jgi:DNA repair exonuclease SbcCD ATPase subunit
MLNKQLKLNIRQLDAQIGEIAEELNGMKENNDYESKVRKIEDLTNLRKALTNDKGGETTISKNVIVEIDNQILNLAKKLTDLELDQEYLSKMRQLDNLTKIRGQLMDSMVKNSSIPTIVSGLISISSILIILKYEEKDLITSKAFNIAMSLFSRGRG